MQQPENQPRSPPHHTSVKRFQHGVLAGPEGALLDLLPYEFKKRKNLSQRHPSICRLRQVDIKHLVLGGVEGDAGHLLLAAVLPVVDRLQGAPLQAFLRPLEPFAATVEPGEVLDLLLPERVAGTEGAHEFLCEGLELFRVFAQRQHGLAVIFVADVSAVLQGIELGVLLGGGAARSGGMLGILARGGEQLGRKLG